MAAWLVARRNKTEVFSEMNITAIFHHSKQNSHTKRHGLIGRRNACLPAACSVFVVFLLFCFFRHLAPFAYQTNDDLFLRMIASGEMSGEPEARLHFISYPAGLLLSLLYRLFPALPWYGLFLCGSFALAMILALCSLLRREKALSARCFTVLLFCLLSYGFLFTHLAQLQFTTCAGVASAGALFLFSVSAPSASFREALKNNAGFLLLSAYAFCLRSQVLLMCFPFLGVLALSKYLEARKLPGISTSDKKSCRKSLYLLGAAFLAMLAAFLLIEKIAYQGSAWQSFRSYSAARASVYDYEGYPDYDAYESTYRELGLTRSSYEAAAHRYSLLLEPAINRHSMEVLENISKQERKISFPDFPQKLREMAAFFLERHLSDADKPINLLVYRCYLLFIICAVFSRKWSSLRDILLTLSARMAIWAYLIFYGRVPVRISQTVYLAELAVLFSIAFGQKLWLMRERPGQATMDKAYTVSPPKSRAAIRQKLCYAAWSASILLIAFTCIRSGIPNAKAAAEESAARLKFSESFTVMKDYFKARPDCFYYLDTNSFAYFTEDALLAGPHENANYLFMGGWAAKSPWYEKKLEAAGISDPAAALCENPAVYAVFMNTEETGYGYLEAFYAENYPGISLEETETVNAGNGISFLILKAVSEKTP